MSTPTTHDPLVVNTQDGSCWTRRAVTRDGRGLYALEGTPRCCPEYVLASLPELAEIGLRGMADVLPVPLGSEESSARRDRYAAAVLKVKSLAGLFADVRAHVDPVMAVADAEMETLRARVAELEAAAGDGSTRTVDEDPIAFALTEQAEYVAPAPSCARCYGADAVRWVANGGAATDCPVCGHSTVVEAVTPGALIASSGAVIETTRTDDVSPQVQTLRGLLARQREDAYRSPLHQDYRTPHDLPEQGARP